MHDAVTMAVRSAPIKTVAPCEGTGTRSARCSIIKGARNLESAKKFYDWALTASAQSAGRQGGGLPGAVQQERRDAAAGPEAREIKLIDYDFAKYGSSAERKRLLEKWGRRSRRSPVARTRRS